MQSTGQQQQQYNLEDFKVRIRYGQERIILSLSIVLFIYVFPAYVRINMDFHVLLKKKLLM